MKIELKKICNNKLMPDSIKINIKPMLRLSIDGMK